MKLNNLDFRYNLESKDFSNLYYVFNILSKPKEKEQFILLAKNSLKILENILDKDLSKKILKKEIGDITSDKISFGYGYYLKNNPLFNSSLKYFFSLNSQGNPNNLSLILDTSYKEDSKNIFIFDSIIKLENLDFSESVKVQIQRINLLRSQGFEINKYLSS